MENALYDMNSIHWIVLIHHKKEVMFLNIGVICSLDLYCLSEVLSTNFQTISVCTYDNCMSRLQNETSEKTIQYQVDLKI